MFGLVLTPSPLTLPSSPPSTPHTLPPPTIPSPQLFIFSQSEVSPGEFECWAHFAEPWGLKAYITWMTLAVFLLPALIITVCQVLSTTETDAHTCTHTARLNDHCLSGTTTRTQHSVTTEQKYNINVSFFHIDRHSVNRGAMPLEGAWDQRPAALRLPVHFLFHYP